MTDENDGHGEILGDLDVRDLRATARITEGDELELILGDGDSAVVLSMSWSRELAKSADTVETVGQELQHFATLLRERAERKQRPLPASEFPEMGVTPIR